MDKTERELRDALVYQIYQKRTGAPPLKAINIHVNPLKCSNNVHINKNFVNESIHYNPKFFVPKPEIHLNPNYVSNIHVNKNFIKKPEPVEIKIEKPKQIEHPIKIKTKYTLIRKNQNEAPVFKKINNRKIIRNSLLKPRTYKRRSYKLIKNNLKIDRRQKYESVFKSIGSRKLIRKSVLQTHIHKRRILKSNFIRKPSDRSFRKKQLRLKKSKNKILQKTQKKKLKKNNQLCAFYNRYGKCKGKSKGTCNKVHDPKYIAICKKLLQGKCTDEDCLLSHDVRPEKMPTCHHYLSGVCTQLNCPFLHIKVSSKAPICPLFLRGFCADCTKRHEYICPIYAEKGTCTRGKSCPYPHPNKPKPQPQPEPTEEKVSKLFILDDEPEDEAIISQSDIRPPPCFKRYFVDKVQEEDKTS